MRCLDIAIVAELVRLLGLSDSEGFDDPQRIVTDALMGSVPHQVTASVDYWEQQRSVVVLGPLPTEPRMPRYPLVIRVDTSAEAVLGTWEAYVLAGLPTADGPICTEDVATFFRRRCGGLTARSADFPLTWAPRPERTNATVALGGDVGLRVAVTSTANDQRPRSRWSLAKRNRVLIEPQTWDWFELELVPPGGTVFQIDREGVDDPFKGPTLWLFTRLLGDEWRVLVIPSPTWIRTEFIWGSQDFGSLIHGAIIATNRGQAGVPDEVEDWEWEE